MSTVIFPFFVLTERGYYQQICIYNIYSELEKCSWFLIEKHLHM